MAFSQRLPAEHYRAVQARVRERAIQAGLDALLLDDPEDVAYLTGFFHFPCERPVAVWLCGTGATVVLVPELEREHAEDQQTVADLVASPEYPGVVGPFEALAAAVPAVERVGHAASMSVGRLRQAQAGFPGVTFLETDVVDLARRRKGPAELALHEEAARISDAMLVAGRHLVEEAVAAGGALPTEAELAAHVTSYGTSTMYGEHEAVVVVSPLAGGLVYAGPNSARPHRLPSASRLRPGDTFMLSLGCAVGGRYVESERTFVLGDPTPDQRRYYEAVRQAQQVGGEAIRPGARCADVNRTCLDVIRDAGLGQHLRHRQGHGIGLGMHEPPWLEDGDASVLEPGMIVSNEPGIYVDGHAGYRMSDSVLVTDEGARPLTSYPRALDDVVIAL
ncbi:MAG: M24 family metallopeptidase [Actinomycetes bacterium]